MDKGTRDDYDLISIHDSENERNLVSRVIEWLKMMDGESPYKISRLQHCLQTATRAEEDGADTETIVCALLHDIGDVISPSNHSQIPLCFCVLFLFPQDKVKTGGIALR
mgnify:CR=1 FL=1